jgi:starvation-inducible DNA-binding protein
MFRGPRAAPARGNFFPIHTHPRSVSHEQGPNARDAQARVPPGDAHRSFRRGRAAISAALNALLADAFALYLKTKNFHWHVSGPHFRDYHLLLDEQAAEIIGTTDDLAERVRRIGGTTLRSIGHVGRLLRIKDNDADFVAPLDMLRELMLDTKTVVGHMRAAHEVADEHDDVATASLLETMIDAAEKRVWFLFEASRSADRTGH